MTSLRHFALVFFNQFNPCVIDGACQSLLARLRFIQSQGKRVSLINYVSAGLPNFYFYETLADTPEDVTREGDTCRAVFRGVPFYERILPFGSETPLNQPAFEAIMQDIGEHQVDFVWTADEAYLPLLTSSLLNIPGMHFFNSPQNVQRFSRQPIHKAFLKGRNIISNSQFLQEKIKSLLGLHSIIWHPFIDVDAYRVRQDDQRNYSIGFSTSGGGSKGNAIVKAILARLPKRSFVIVGNGFDQPDGAFQKNLTLLGHVTDMKPFYSQIDILLVPSVAEESHPRVILEAAVNGIPTIANRIGGVSEALGDSGILIDYNEQMDISAVAEKYVVEICRLLDDNVFYAKYRRKALVRAESYMQMQGQQADEIFSRYFS